MRAISFIRSWCGFALFVLVTGCGNDPEEICKDLCDYEEKCAGEAIDGGTSVNCDEKQCADALDEMSSGCQDAIGDLYSCLNDQDSCSSESIADCGSELGDYVEECADEAPFN